MFYKRVCIFLFALTVYANSCFALTASESKKQESGTDQIILSQKMTQYEYNKLRQSYILHRKKYDDINIELHNLEKKKQENNGCITSSIDRQKRGCRTGCRYFDNPVAEYFMPHKGNTIIDQINALFGSCQCYDHCHSDDISLKEKTQALQACAERIENLETKLRKFKNLGYKNICEEIYNRDSSVFTSSMIGVDSKNFLTKRFENGQLPDVEDILKHDTRVLGPLKNKDTYSNKQKDLGKKDNQAIKLSIKSCANGFVGALQKKETAVFFNHNKNVSGYDDEKAKTTKSDMLSGLESHFVARALSQLEGASDPESSQPLQFFTYLGDLKLQDSGNNSAAEPVDLKRESKRNSDESIESALAAFQQNFGNIPTKTPVENKKKNKDASPLMLKNLKFNTVIGEGNTLAGGLAIQVAEITARDVIGSDQKSRSIYGLVIKINPESGRQYSMLTGMACENDFIEKYKAFLDFDAPSKTPAITLKSGNQKKV